MIEKKWEELEFIFILIMLKEWLLLEKSIIIKANKIAKALP